MSGFEVKEPILCSPYEEPAEHWVIHEGTEPVKAPGRRPPIYYYRNSRVSPDGDDGVGQPIEMKLVSLIRERVTTWRAAGYPGVTRMTLQLLQHWRRDGQETRRFFAQLEAVETIIFLAEARADLRQGVEIPLDDLSEDKQAEGYKAFTRHCCKMATGTGKTTVMAMLAAWTILASR